MGEHDTTIPQEEFLKDREMYTVEAVMTRILRVKVDAQSVAEARRDGLKLISGELEDWASNPKYTVTKITKRKMTAAERNEILMMEGYIHDTFPESSKK